MNRTSGIPLRDKFTSVLAEAANIALEEEKKKKAQLVHNHPLRAFVLDRRISDVDTILQDELHKVRAMLCKCKDTLVRDLLAAIQGWRIGHHEPFELSASREDVEKWCIDQLLTSTKVEHTDATGALSDDASDARRSERALEQRLHAVLAFHSTRDEFTLAVS